MWKKNPEILTKYIKKSYLEDDIIKFEYIFSLFEKYYKVNEIFNLIKIYIS